MAAGSRGVVAAGPAPLNAVSERCIIRSRDAAPRAVAAAAVAAALPLALAAPPSRGVLGPVEVGVPLRDDDADTARLRASPLADPNRSSWSAELEPIPLRPLREAAPMEYTLSAREEPSRLYSCPLTASIKVRMSKLAESPDCALGADAAPTSAPPLRRRQAATMQQAAMLAVRPTMATAMSTMA